MGKCAIAHKIQNHCIPIVSIPSLHLWFTTNVTVFLFHVFLPFIHSNANEQNLPVPAHYIFQKSIIFQIILQVKKISSTDNRQNWKSLFSFLSVFYRHRTNRRLGTKGKFCYLKICKILHATRSRSIRIANPWIGNILAHGRKTFSLTGLWCHHRNWIEIPLPVPLGCP